MDGPRIQTTGRPLSEFLCSRHQPLRAVLVVARYWPASSNSRQRRVRSLYLSRLRLPEFVSVLPGVRAFPPSGYARRGGPGQSGNPTADRSFSIPGNVSELSVIPARRSMENAAEQLSAPFHIAFGAATPG